jgi:hypothetical protein
LKGSRRKVLLPDFGTQNRAALREARNADRVEPRATAAAYDPARRLIMVDLRNGCTVGFPPDRVPALKGARPDQLAAIRIAPSGDGLHWDELDAHASLTGLVAEAFNLAEWAPRPSHPLPEP